MAFNSTANNSNTQYASGFSPEVDITQDDFPESGLYGGRRVKRLDMNGEEFTYDATMQKWLSEPKQGNVFIPGTTQATYQNTLVLPHSNPYAAYYIRRFYANYYPASAANSAANYYTFSYAAYVPNPGTGSTGLGSGVNTQAATTIQTHYEFGEELDSLVAPHSSFILANMTPTGAPGSFLANMAFDYSTVGAPRRLVDSFDRPAATYMAASDSSQDWFNLQGTYGVNSNGQAYSTTDANLDICYAESMLNDFVLTVDISGQFDSTSLRRIPAIAFRMLDLNNFFYLSPTPTTLELWRKKDGAYGSALTSFSYNFTNGQSYRIKIIAIGYSMFFYASSNAGSTYTYLGRYFLTLSDARFTQRAYGLKGTGIQSDSAPYLPATKIGLFLIKSGSPTVPATWDNLSVRPLTTIYPASSGLVANFVGAADTTYPGAADTGQDWSIDNGTWGRDGSGNLYPVVSSANSLGAVITTKNPYKTGYTISAKMSGTQSASGVTSNVIIPGLMFGYRDIYNYFYIQAYQGSLVLNRLTNGGASTIASVPFTTTDNQVVTYTVTVNGPLITITANGVTMITYQLGTFGAAQISQYHSDRIGFRVGLNGTPTVTAKFTALSVTQI